LATGEPSLFTQGSIAVWKVKVGDKVSAGDVLCDVQTDKATMEMESMEDGYIAQILVAANSGDIPCGQVRRLTQPPLPC
jgi:pyruvate dehydrogenase E2 component (dihydrolipoamide acetyltransferase)